jgi:hypothetical protein
MQFYSSGAIMATDDSNEVYLRRYISTAIKRTKTKQAAIDRLESEARNDKFLWRMLTEPFLRQACQLAVENFTTPSTGKSSKPAHPSKPVHQDQCGARLRFAADSLMEFRLLEGLPLGHAMKSDVVATAASYNRIAQSKMVRAKWLTLIAEKMPDNKTVGDLFTEKDLKRFMKAATK